MKLSNQIRGALIDVDGVLHVDGVPVDGAVDALAALRRRGTPFRLLTNTTLRTRASLGQMLRGQGFDVDDGEIMTAAAATADYVRRHHSGEACYLLVAGDAAEEFADVPLTEGPDATVVIIGGAGSVFTYEAMNHAYRLLLNGAGLVAMHKNTRWLTAEGMTLDSGAYVHGLEYAADVRATVIGKPSPAFFEAGFQSLGLEPEQVVMVGDSNSHDVLPAMALGAAGILVRTGVFRESDLTDGAPNCILGSIADLPDAIDNGVNR